MEFIFLFLTFSLCVLLDLKWDFCRQHIYRSYFCIHIDGPCFYIHSSTLYLLIWTFSQFTFKIVFLIVILLFLVAFELLFFFLSSSFTIFPYDLMTVFSVMVEFLSTIFVCVSYVDFWFMGIMRFMYNNLYVYLYLYMWLFSISHLLKSTTY